MKRLLERFLAWWRDQPHALELASGGALIFSLASLIAVPWLAIRIPPDWFAREAAPPLPWARAHPLLRVLLHGAKNVLGAVFLVAGVALIMLPGQGLLTLFLGLTLVDFPGKRRLELRLVRRPMLRHAIDWIRRRAHRAPLVLPPLAHHPGAPQSRLHS